MNTQMNLDEQFRTELHDAIDSYTATRVSSVYAAPLIAAGTRVVRRRRMIAAGGALAVVVLALFGGSMLEHIVVPPDVNPGEPSANQDQLLDRVRSATLTLPPGPATLPGEPAKFMVQIGPSAGGQPESDLGYYSLRSGGILQLMGGSSTAGLVGKSTLGYGGGDVVVGIVPEDAVAVSLQTGYDGNTGGFTQSTLQAIPGTDYKAVAFRLHQLPSAGDQDFRTIWWRADGTPVTNDGVGSVAHFAAADQGLYDFWAIPNQDLVGARGPSGSSMTPLSALWATGQVGEFDLTAYSEDATGQTPTMTGTLVRAYVIKGRVGNVNTTFAPDLRAGRTDTKYWSQLGATVVLSRADMVDTPVPNAGPPSLLTELTWTDSYGKAQSYQPQ